MNLIERIEKLFKKENKEQCIWYDASREQYQIHLEENLDKTWIGNYVNSGCFSCNGKDKTCMTYYKKK